ncbi:MAG: translation initiation factor translation initiation factor, partial [Candidatus Parcubacteria bacterium]
MTENAPQEIKKRPPVVVVMGHVDHGKTSLLDYVRRANVVSREAGGITQAVAAYEIVHADQKITFIDTPGHEAFASMRNRGAKIADLAIVVVAADESIKPQTLEAVTILQESKTPFVIAINKIDREDANVERVKNDFTAAGIYLEGYGGQI